MTQKNRPLSDDEIRGLYRQMQDVEPPHVVDTAILSAAKQSIEKPVRSAYSFSPRRRAVLSLAAGLLLALVIIPDLFQDKSWWSDDPSLQLGEEIPKAPEARKKMQGHEAFGLIEQALESEARQVPSKLPEPAGFSAGAGALTEKRALQPAEVPLQGKHEEQGDKSRQEKPGEPGVAFEREEALMMRGEQPAVGVQSRPQTTLDATAEMVNADALAERIERHLEQGDIEAAVELFSIFLQRFPGHPMLSELQRRIYSD